MHHGSFYITLAHGSPRPPRERVIDFARAIGIDSVERAEIVIFEDDELDTSELAGAFAMSGDITIHEYGRTPDQSRGSDLSIDSCLDLWPTSESRALCCALHSSAAQKFVGELRARHGAPEHEMAPCSVSCNLWLGRVHLDADVGSITGKHDGEALFHVAVELEFRCNLTPQSSLHQALNALPSVRRIRKAMGHHLGDARTILYLI